MTLCAVSAGLDKLSALKAGILRVWGIVSLGRFASRRKTQRAHATRVLIRLMPRAPENWTLGFVIVP